MKSKTSFFNKTVFEKNIKLFWPLWALYMIILLLMGPLSMWSRYRTAENYYGKDWQLHMSGFLSPAIAMRPTVIIIFIMAVCTGMALFNYLYSQKACNMIHRHIRLLRDGRWRAKQCGHLLHRTEKLE